MATKKKAAKKKAAKKTPPKPPREHYEVPEEDLKYVGPEAYEAARKVQEQLRTFGILGELMRGKKRSEIRKEWRISPNKLNKLLDSESVDDIAAYAINSLFSMQNVCLAAILHKIQVDRDGALAMALMEKLGILNKDRIARLTGEAQSGTGNTTPERRLFALLFGEGMETGQAAETLAGIVQNLKSKLA
jgi:hypothetical protein